MMASLPGCRCWPELCGDAKVEGTWKDRCARGFCRARLARTAPPRLPGWHACLRLREY